MVQIGEKDQGCKMINGVEEQYPEANQSVIQKQNMSLKNLSAINKTHNLINRTLKNIKLNKLFLKFSKNLNLNSSFAVGVSGGPDSLALAYLCKVYALKHGIKEKFYIVDHKLRSNSTQEAQYVRKILKKILLKLKY